MFGTIKSKITVITLTTLLALLLVVSFYAYIFLRDSKSLLLKTYSYSIGVIAQDINKEVIKIENNAKDLALMGGLFYSADRNPIRLKRVITGVFYNYDDSLGGGIWFEPYVVNSAQKRFCVYAYRNKDNKVVIDENFISEEYNYLNQKWYREIFPKVNTLDNIEWSSPYFEKQGSNTLMITAGAGIYDNKGKKVGISTVDWEISQILKQIAEIKPTPNSFALFADKNNDYILVSTDKYLNNSKLVGKSLSNIPWYTNNLKAVTYFTYHNQKFIPYVKTLDNNMILIVCIPKTELFYSLIIHVIGLFTVLIALSGIMAYLLYFSLKRNILKPIDKLTHMASRIGQGENVEIKIEKPEEFAQLASTFNKMTNDIKVITKEKAKISSELSVAKAIQESSLPRIFPPYPNNTKFDIYASMEAAKEVGGDFYDFYFIDVDKFMFFIADVSGKGIPAALFMMTAKELIGNISHTQQDVRVMIEAINKKICSNNSQGLFITLLAGIVNVNTGKITYVNCGHNHPLIKTNNGEYKYLSLPSNIVLGAFENMKFEVFESQLSCGDTIFFYTDGLTEASNGLNLFGERRLLETVNKFDDKDLKLMSENIKSEIKKFAGDIEQSDDITMLVFKYTNYPTEEYKYKDKAIKDNYKKFYTWMHQICDNWNLDESLRNKIDMCAEEIYANITFYAYPGSSGDIEVIITHENSEINLTFVDGGIQYNPLERENPDITLPPEDRQLGGLGIYMVKELSDNASYRYENSQNILELTFKTNA